MDSSGVSRGWLPSSSFKSGARKDDGPADRTDYGVGGGGGGTGWGSEGDGDNEGIGSRAERR